MTVRTAEILIAVVLALCSIGLMIKSAELNIGWVARKGPGSGAWPFWLSTGMLLTCLWTIVRWFRRITPESRSTELYMSATTVKVVGTSAFSILFLLLVTQFMGIYIALLLFLLFYLKVIGQHSWALTLSLVICVPVFIFALFEWGLKIPLPKAFTEEWFYPVYDLMYAQNVQGALASFKAPIVSVPIFATLLVPLFWGWRFFTQRGVVSQTSDN
ncbi:MAG: tripartite tricarboxylate transporter TctB family protein [Gammaproteobacteria bacterium]|nr:tripartite tricarboxylate transporter TctB family protein [Gammaproteobacteria bacterium]